MLVNFIFGTRVITVNSNLFDKYPNSVLYQIINNENYVCEYISCFRENNQINININRDLENFEIILSILKGGEYDFCNLNYEKKTSIFKDILFYKLNEIITEKNSLDTDIVTNIQNFFDNLNTNDDIFDFNTSDIQFENIKSENESKIDLNYFQYLNNFFKKNGDKINLDNIKLINEINEINEIEDNKIMNENKIVYTDERIKKLPKELQELFEEDNSDVEKDLNLDEDSDIEIL